MSTPQQPEPESTWPVVIPEPIPTAQPAAPPAGPPAGWYPDPQILGTLRYWDGRAWTDARAPIPSPATPAPTTVVVGQQRESPGCASLTCAGIILVILIGFAVIVFL
ncbi:MAG: DUF2510 domain-containing protein [Actinomycetales bacterium]|nr:DUF2510 domain-containing protein [Actinomycetales bacterium]